MSGKFALIIGNTEYADPGLAQLTAPGKDAEDFARVLNDPNICGFDNVKVLLNHSSSSIIEAIDEFFDQKKPDDMLVLFFSGHGVRDEIGSLYLAVKNTIRTRLRSTAIKSDYIREVMDQSRSRRQLLILDCCNSGAFAQGTKAELGGTMGMVSAFQGYGRYVLTASDATQFAWEGDKVIGGTENSLFTHFLVKGLEGEADGDGDGKITVDELYDYAFEQIVSRTPKQKPNKSATKQEGEIILRQITRIEDIKPMSLPDELIEATEDSRTFVREGAVQQLEKIIKGKNLGLARSARAMLERLEREDDSRRVSQAATQALEAVRAAEQAALQKAEEERVAREREDAERKAKEESEKLLHTQAEREVAKREAARQEVERQAAELAALEAAEKGEKEKAETKAAERAAPKAEREAVKVAAKQQTEEQKKSKVAGQARTLPRLFWPIVGGVVISVALCGYIAARFLPSIFGGTAAIQTPTRIQPSGITPPAQSATRTPESVLPVSFECTDTLGCVEIPPGEPIHLAYALVIAGPDETLGIDSRIGIEVAIDMKGKILGHDIQLTGEDDGCSAEGGQAAGSKLSADPTVVAVIATSCSSAARVAVPLLSQAGLVIISPSNTAPDLTRPGDPNQHPGYFRTSYNDEIQGAAAAHFAFEKLGVKKAATIHDGSLYAESLQAVFAETFQELGGEITSQEAVDPNATDFKSVLINIAAGEPEFIYHPVFIKAGSLIINQAKQVPGLENVYLMGADGMFSPDVVEGAGDAVEGTFVSSPDLASFGGDYASVFLPKYRELSGQAQPISIFHAHAFDAGNMIFAAIEKVAVQTVDGTLHIPRQALRDALYATKDFQGLTGNLTCSPTGDCADPKIAVYEYHAGEYPPQRIWP